MVSHKKKSPIKTKHKRKHTRNHKQKPLSNVTPITTLPNPISTYNPEAPPATQSKQHTFTSIFNYIISICNNIIGTKPSCITNLNSSTYTHTNNHANNYAHVHTHDHPHDNSHTHASHTPQPTIDYKDPTYIPPSSTLKQSYAYTHTSSTPSTPAIHCKNINGTTQHNKHMIHHDNLKIYNKKNQKKRIPKTLRRDVWEKVHGPTLAKGKCYVKWCTRILDKMEFQAGHNIPESKGGTIDVHNLYPICAECNQAMGDRYTIDEWSNLAFMIHVNDDFKNNITIQEWDKISEFVRHIITNYPHILEQNH